MAAIVASVRVGFENLRERALAKARTVDASTAELYREWAESIAAAEEEWASHIPEARTPTDAVLFAIDATIVTECSAPLGATDAVTHGGLVAQWERVLRKMDPEYFRRSAIDPTDLARRIALAVLSPSNEDRKGHEEQVNAAVADWLDLPRNTIGDVIHDIGDIYELGPNSRRIASNVVQLAQFEMAKKRSEYRKRKADTAATGRKLGAEEGIHTIMERAGGLVIGTLEAFSVSAVTLSQLHERTRPYVRPDGSVDWLSFLESRGWA